MTFLESYRVRIIIPQWCGTAEHVGSLGVPVKVDGVEQLVAPVHPSLRQEEVL